jgi:hypothetical protein
MRKPRSYIVVLFEGYYPRYRGGEIYERPGGNTVGAYIWCSDLKIKNKHKRLPKKLLALGLKNVVGKNIYYREFETIDDAKRWIKTENSDFHELFTVEI